MIAPIREVDKLLIDQPRLLGERAVYLDYDV